MPSPLIRNRDYSQLLRKHPDLELQLQLLRSFEKELDQGRMRMHPYILKPWRTNSKRRLMAKLSLCLIFGSGLSYFLMQVLKMGWLEAVLCGGALFLVLFLMVNFCVCFKASRVQALNETISEVSQNFAREIDTIMKTNLE